jgi:hypothetical protein
MKSLFAAIFVLLVLCSAAVPGAIITVDEKASIDLGLRLHTHVIRTDRDADKDGMHFETVDDFAVRRARIRLGGSLNDLLDVFLQTDVKSEHEGEGMGMKMIDAFAEIKPDRWFRIVAGEHIPPVMRQNLTSSASLLAFDRPAIASKPLSWGTRAPTAFGTTNIRDTDAGLRVSGTGRDQGVTFFGSGPAGWRGFSLKYYAGAYEGVRSTAGDHLHYAARMQVNYGDAESDYLVSGTYLGSRNIIAIGIAADAQRGVALDGARAVDYSSYTADLFIEQPIGGSSLTFEAAVIRLDLDHAGHLAADSGTGQQAQGHGYYLQAGYLIRQRWQPWAEWEVWESDDPLSIGGFVTYRAGLSYFLKGQNANIKLAYESMNADHNFTDVVGADCVESYILGLFVDY